MLDAGRQWLAVCHQAGEDDHRWFVADRAGAVHHAVFDDSISRGQLGFLTRDDRQFSGGFSIFAGAHVGHFIVAADEAEAEGAGLDGDDQIAGVHVRSDAAARLDDHAHQHQCLCLGH